MENGINRLEVGRVEFQPVNQYSAGCHCGACEEDRAMAKSTITTVVIVVVILLAAAYAYKNIGWIKAKLGVPA